jgi:hypothetical protein
MKMTSASTHEIDHDQQAYSGVKERASTVFRIATLVVWRPSRKSFVFHGVVGAGFPRDGLQSLQYLLHCCGGVLVQRQAPLLWWLC